MLLLSTTATDRAGTGIEENNKYQPDREFKVVVKVCLSTKLFTKQNDSHHVTKPLRE